MTSQNRTPRPDSLTREQIVGGTETQQIIPESNKTGEAIVRTEGAQMARRHVNLEAAVRRARQRLASQGGFTLPELLVVIVVAGLIIGVMATGFLTSAKTASEASTRLDESHDAQMVAAYFNADVANAQFFSLTSTGTSSCSAPAAATRVAMMSWKEGAITKDAFYYRPAGTDELKRRYCQNNAVVSDIAVAENLGVTGPTVTCRAPLGCAALPGWVNIDVDEESGYSYQLRGRPRAASATGGAMANYAIYIGGGGLDLNSAHSDLSADGAVYIAGGLKCNNNSTLNVDDTALYGSTGGGDADDCGDTDVSTSIIEKQDDPLGTLAYPDRATLAAATTTADATCPGGLQHNPGYHTTVDETINGCLASGIHYFDNGAVFKDVKAAPAASILIFVAKGDLALAPHQDDVIDMGDLADNDYGNVAVFMHRDPDNNPATLTTIRTKGHVNIDGIIYGAGSKFDAQTPHEDFHALGINVQWFDFNSGGGITVEP